MKFFNQLFNIVKINNFEKKYSPQQLILIHLSSLTTKDKDNPKKEEYQKTDKMFYEKIKTLVEKMQKESIKEEEKFRLINHSLIYLLRGELDIDKTRKNDYLVGAINLLWDKMICWDWHLDWDGLVFNLKSIKQEYNFLAKLKENNDNLIFSHQADQMLNKILSTLEKDDNNQNQKKIKKVVFRLGLIDRKLSNVFINHLKNKLIKESILIDSVNFIRSQEIKNEKDFKIFDAYWDGLLIGHNLNKTEKNNKMKL